MHVFHIVGSQTRYCIPLAHIFHTVAYISYRITMGISMRFWLLFFLLLLYTNREAKIIKLEFGYFVILYFFGVELTFPVFQVMNVDIS